MPYRIQNFKNVKHFYANNNGSVAIEMAVIFPLLLLLIGGIVQFGIIFFVESNMERVSREISRSISVGRLEAENGGLVSCEFTSGFSAEARACELLSGLPGSYSVSAIDNSYAFTEISVSRDSILLFDLFSFINRTGQLSVSAEAVLEGGES